MMNFTHKLIQIYVKLNLSMKSSKHENFRIPTKEKVFYQLIHDTGDQDHKSVLKEYCHAAHSQRQRLFSDVNQDPIFI